VSVGDVGVVVVVAGLLLQYDLIENATPWPWPCAHMLFVVSEQGTVAPAAIFPILRRLQRSHLDLPGGKSESGIKDQLASGPTRSFLSARI
jgi:hypothetical protein